jgi:hypothetical protein
MKGPYFNVPQKIAICVTFHFNKSRLHYLELISRTFKELAEDVDLTIVTNASSEEDLDQIKAVVEGKARQYSVFTPVGLGHPFLLPWVHFHIFRRLFEDPSFSHFLYIEDDILITRENIVYWMESRELLRDFEFIPSFLRVEKKRGAEDWYSSDCIQRFQINSLPRIQIREDLLFVNLHTPYQGMYFLDRALMSEHLSGKSSSPDFGIIDEAIQPQTLRFWGIREKAAQGLTFHNVREGFISRNLIPYKLKSHEIDKRCLIHHTPNNYANQLTRTNLFGTIPIKGLVIE